MPLQHHAVRRIFQLHQTRHLERKQWLSYIGINDTKDDEGGRSYIVSKENNKRYRWSVVRGNTLHLASRYAEKGQAERKREDS